MLHGTQAACHGGLCHSSGDAGGPAPLSSWGTEQPVSGVLCEGRRPLPLGVLEVFGLGSLAPAMYGRPGAGCGISLGGFAQLQA